MSVQELLQRLRLRQMLRKVAGVELGDLWYQRLAERAAYEGKR